MDLINVFDFEKLAGEKLFPAAFDYYSSGAHDEITLRENREAYDRLKVMYRVMIDVGRRDASTKVLGHAVSMPILIAPTAFHRMAHPDGEIAVTKAAGAAGTVMILSSLANTAVEDVTAAATGPVWYQLYIYRDREVTREVVRRAERAGCAALVLTVDAPMLGRRERDFRNRFQLPPGLNVRNVLPEGLAEFPKEALDSGLAAYFSTLIDPSVTWKDIDWLRSITKMPILVKGIVRADDAVRAVASGADAIVVSNHGGRQLDTSPSTIEVLPEIALAVAGRIEVLMDGGIRRGTDVLKALALGAKAVLVGRPILWGLAVDGENGVARILDILRAELDLAMALAGCPSIDSITPDLIRRPVDPGGYTGH